MSTQHPDNVRQPFFAREQELSGDDEVREAHYAFTHLGCEEQMWDFEGKEGDPFVVKKLLSADEQFFKEKKLGKDVFITVRVPNPTFEHAEAKILLETLESIPRSFDAARLATGEDTAPIFEVIMPMTTSVKDLNRVYHYYRDFVIGKQKQYLQGDDMTIADWVGPSSPESIDVIPLFEDKDSMLASADILREYLKDKEASYARVFLARSDPAVNYGLIAAVLLNVIALSRLHSFGQKQGIAVYPILGVGSVPFRGHARPGAIEHILDTYPSVATFTIQSSFKYDYPTNEVIRAIAQLNAHTPSVPRACDEPLLLGVVEAYIKRYQQELGPLIPHIQELAPHIPRRRKRKMHIGLFGYSRQMNGHALPRAIPFVASLYSLGVPPEILGLSSLSLEDIQNIERVYPSFRFDIQQAARYCDLESPFVTREMRDALQPFIAEQHEEYIVLARRVRESFARNDRSQAPDLILRLASLRGFLG